MIEKKRNQETMKCEPRVREGQKRRRRGKRGGEGKGKEGKKTNKGEQRGKKTKYGNNDVIYFFPFHRLKREQVFALSPSKSGWSLKSRKPKEKEEGSLHAFLYLLFL